MANEIQVSITVSANKPTTMTAAVARSMLNLLRNMTSNAPTYGMVQASGPASSNAVLIPLGQLVPGTTPASSSTWGVSNTPHFLWVANMDTSNSNNIVRILDGNAASAVIAEIAPQDIGFIPLWGNCKPYAYIPSNTQNPFLEYFVMGY